MTQEKSRNKNEVTSNIAGIRAIEDCIRATRKYTEGIGTIRKQHPIQGTDFPSRVFCKYYEVYPETELSWDMPAGVALDWLWGDILRVDVTFRYDYRTNKASMVVQDGPVAVLGLEKTIPGFREALAAATSSSSSSSSISDRQISHIKD